MFSIFFNNKSEVDPEIRDMFKELESSLEDAGIKDVDFKEGDCFFGGDDVYQLSINMRGENIAANRGLKHNQFKKGRNGLVSLTVDESSNRDHITGNLQTSGFVTYGKRRGHEKKVTNVAGGSKNLSGSSIHQLEVELYGQVSDILDDSQRGNWETVLKERAKKRNAQREQGRRDQLDRDMV